VVFDRQLFFATALEARCKVADDIHADLLCGEEAPKACGLRRRGSSDGARRGAIRAFLAISCCRSSFDHRAPGEGPRCKAFTALLVADASRLASNVPKWF